MTHNVQIPKGYFFKQSKQEYADVYTRLIQELVQNSVDAGAKNIYLDFTDNGYSCADDGVGMTGEVLTNGMLTFGGSQKSDEVNNCGGFGYAKVLILFSMESFIIQTRNNLASGEGLNYSLDTNHSFYQGTKISCKFPQNWGNDKYQMAGYAERFLSKCQLRCNVYVNGVQFTNWDYVTRSIRHNEWSKDFRS